MLKAGGRTKEEADKHWVLLSNLLRKIRKEVRENCGPE